MSEQEFLEYLRARENLYFYGAGVVAKRVLRFCDVNNIHVEGIVVTDREDDFISLGGIPVTSLEELIHSDEIDVSQIDLLVCVKVEAYGGTCYWNDYLYDISFRSRFILPPKINEILKKKELEYDLKLAINQLSGIKVDINNKNVEQNHLILMDDLGRAFSRCETIELINHTEEFNSFCNSKEIQMLYGDIKHVPIGENVDINVKNASVEEKVGLDGTDSYVMICHLDDVEEVDIKEQGYIPLQVGAALTDIRKASITDDSRDNISIKNRDYSECTGIYWIWKNTSGNKYVGINHYRRRLIIDNTSMKYIKNENVDVVLTLAHFCPTTIKEFFMQFVSKQDWQLMKDSILMKYPDCRELWEMYENSHFYFHGNLALWKREWFDKYSEFAFSIAFNIEEEYVKRGIIRQDRYMGFLFENLTSFYVMMHKDELNICCTQMRWSN